MLVVNAIEVVNFVVMSDDAIVNWAIGGGFEVYCVFEEVELVKTALIQHSIFVLSGSLPRLNKLYYTALD